MLSSKVSVVFLLLFTFLTESSFAIINDANGTEVCYTEACWRMSMALQSSLKTSTDPCEDFEEFLCGGFRSEQHFKGQSLLQKVLVHLDYIQRTASGYSERVTEQLATGCWESNCTNPGHPWIPLSTKLRAYERLAVRALRDCATLEANVEDWSFPQMLRNIGGDIIDEISDLSVKGLDFSSRQQFRLERLLPAQSAKSLTSPLTAIPGIARLNGNPALLLLAGDHFNGFTFAGPLFTNLPWRGVRLARLLRLSTPLGSLNGLIRRAHSDLLLWSEPCNRTAEAVLDGSLVQTVGDAKRLLQRANLTFNLDEFLTWSIRLTIEPPVTDQTPLVLPDARAFVRTVCVLEKCGRRITELPKLIVINQVCTLAMSIFATPNDFTCIKALFGRHEDDSRIINFEGAFRPLLHGRHARFRRAELLAVEAEISELFVKVKTAYAAALDAQEWISQPEKSVLKRRLERTQLRFLTEHLSEQALLRHFNSVLGSMPQECTIASSPACLLVRAYALQQYLAMRTTQTTFDQGSPHYAALQEAVIIPPAFLEYPHYLSKQPPSVRVGIQAFVLAHELTHGVLGEAIGLENSTFEDRLRERQDCLRQRLILELGLNKMNVKEDVADMIGLLVTLRTLADTANRDLRLPGYMERFSPEQLLYIASLRTFCTKSGPNFERHFLEIGSRSWSHTPGRLRIRGLLAGDNGSFARAFGCPEPSTTAAAVADQCRIW